MSSSRLGTDPNKLVTDVAESLPILYLDRIRNARDKLRPSARTFALRCLCETRNDENRNRQEARADTPTSPASLERLALSASGLPKLHVTTESSPLPEPLGDPNGWSGWISPNDVLEVDWPNLNVMNRWRLKQLKQSAPMRR